MRTSVTDIEQLCSKLAAGNLKSGATTAHNDLLADVDDDGDLDLMLHFANQDMGLSDDSMTVSLSGVTDGVPIVGTDMVDPVRVGSTDSDDTAANGNGNGNGRVNGRGR